MDTLKWIGQVEQELDLAFGALLGGDASALVQHVSVVLSGGQGLADAELPPDAVQRLKQIALRTRALREAILRKQSLNELALQQLVPATQQPTYGGGGASLPASPYAGVARASGRLHQVLQA